MDDRNENQRDHIASCGSGFLRFWDHWTALPKTNLVPVLEGYLDNVEPKVQPGVVMMDFMPNGTMKVRLAGTGIVDVIGEITHATADDIYHESVKGVAFTQGWKALSHPCGFTVNRTFKDVTGRKGSANALVLPIETTPDRKTAVSYNGIPTFGANQADNEVIQAIIGFKDLRWIDIGAGVPSA